MALAPEFKAGMRFYGLVPEVDAERVAVWDLLAPEMSAIAKRVAQSFKALLPHRASAIEAGAPVIMESIVRCTGNLFIRPYDETWLSETIDRANLERISDLDLRVRLAINSQILTALSELAARRHRFSGRKAARVIDVGKRVLLYDSSIAMYHHYTHKMRKARDTGKQLTNALEVFERATNEVRRSVSRGAASLRETSQELQTVFDGVDEEATRASNASHSTATHIARAAQATETLSSAIEDLERESALSAAEATAAAEQMRRANETIATLSSAVQRIGTVVDVVADVARQTNLLALNAAIEAARAGETGRGFAVVAQEVKGLATQTSAATLQIAELIAAIQANTEDSVGRMEGAGCQIDNVADISRRLAVAVHKQMAASDDIAHTAGASAATMTAALATVSARIGRTRDTALSILTLSEELASQTRTLDGASEALFVWTREREASVQPLANFLPAKVLAGNAGRD